MILEELALWLEYAGLGTVGTDIFIGERPSEPSSFIFLYEQAGVGFQYVHELSTPKYEMARIALECKDPIYSSARRKAQRCIDALGHLLNTYVGNTFYQKCTPEQPPFLINIDDQRRHFIGFSILVEKSVSQE